MARTSGLYMLTVPKLLFRIPGRSGAKHCIIRIIMSTDIFTGQRREISNQKSTKVDPYHFYVSIVTFEHHYFATTPSS